jgi:hypothetical protein
MLPVPIYDRIPEVRFLEHRTLVEDQIPIDGVNPGMSGHPVLLEQGSDLSMRNMTNLHAAHLL